MSNDGRARVHFIPDRPDRSSGQASNQQINSASNQQLLIHDALGRLVWTRKLDAGVEQVKIDLAAERFEDGVYQISWVTEDGVITKSLVVAKR